MKTVVLLSGATALAVAVALATGGAASSEQPAAIPDTSLGLARGSVLDVPTPPVVRPNETAPGEQPALARPYAIAPPRIPHGVADFLPITTSENACVGCHEVKDKKPGEPTPIPPSHYTDYRNGPAQAGSRLVGARHVCVACHVPTTDAPDLLEDRPRP